MSKARRLGEAESWSIPQQPDPTGTLSAWGSGSDLSSVGVGRAQSTIGNCELLRRLPPQQAGIESCGARAPHGPREDGHMRVETHALESSHNDLYGKTSVPPHTSELDVNDVNVEQVKIKPNEVDDCNSNSSDTSIIMFDLVVAYYKAVATSNRLSREWNGKALGGTHTEYGTTITYEEYLQSEWLKLVLRIAALLSSTCIDRQQAKDVLSRYAALQSSTSSHMRQIKEKDLEQAKAELSKTVNRLSDYSNALSSYEVNIAKIKDATAVVDNLKALSTLIKYIVKLAPSSPAKAMIKLESNTLGVAMDTISKAMHRIAEAQMQAQENFLSSEAGVQGLEDLLSRISGCIEKIDSLQKIISSLEQEMAPESSESDSEDGE